MKTINIKSVIIGLLIIILFSCTKEEETSEDSIPSTPYGLSATASGTQITIDWVAPSGADSYTLYWKTSSGVSTSDTAITLSTNQYIHTSLTNGTYFYAVTATNSTGTTSLSSEVYATIANDLSSCAQTVLNNSIYTYRNCFSGSTSFGACETCGYYTQESSASGAYDCITCPSGYELDVYFSDCTGYCVITGTATNPSSSSNCTPRVSCVKE